MGARKRKGLRAPTHVYRCIKQAIAYAPSTSEHLTWLARQSERAYNKGVATALDALASGEALPRIAHAQGDRPAGDSMLKQLTRWRAEASWKAVPVGVQRNAVGEATSCVARWDEARARHAQDILDADARARAHAVALAEWKARVKAWQDGGRAGARPAHPGRCKGVPRRAERGDPDEGRLFRSRKVRERAGEHRFACAGDALVVRSIDAPKLRPKEAEKYADAPGRWVQDGLPGGVVVVPHVYLAPGESVAKIEVCERAPTRSYPARRARKAGGAVREAHRPVGLRAPSERGYRCILTIGRRAPRLRNPAGRWGGNDPGVVHPCTFAVDGESEARFVDLPEARIAPLQARIEAEVAARRNFKRGSRRWHASWRRQRALDRKVRNICDDVIVQALGKLLDDICGLGLEDTEWKNLMASARGMSLDPGTNVAAKRALNRRIGAVAPGRLRLKLASMCARRGVWLVLTPAAGSSITCHACGKRSAKNRPSQSVFKCIACGRTDHADANAAKNHRDNGRSRAWRRIEQANVRFNQKTVTGGARVSPPPPGGKSGADACTHNNNNSARLCVEQGGAEAPTDPVVTARGRHAERSLARDGQTGTALRAPV